MTPALTDLPALPARLTATDLMQIFGIHKSRFYVLAAQGKFDRFLLKPTIGRKAWSGAKVAAYLRGEGRAA